MPVRVLNLTHEKINVDKGQLVGKIETVQIATEQPASPSPLSVEKQIHVGHQLTAKQEAEFSELIKRFHDVFALTENDVGNTDVVQHTINTGNVKPIRTAPRRLPHCHQQEAESQLEWLLENKIVRPSSSPWSSPIVLVKKKNGAMRMCVDYRRLNAVTTKDTFPLPRMDETLDSLANCTIFSTLDLYSGYHQVSLAEEDVAKSAFSTHKGLYEYLRMPFGLCSAPATFQRLMSVVLNGMIGDQCFVYLDDIIVLGKTFAEHLSNLERVFSRLREAGLRLKPTKCHFLKQEVQFLGHLVSGHGVRADPRKVADILSWPSPTSKTELKSFMGLAGYYRRFIEGFSKLASPLFRVSGLEVFEWTEECQTAFDSLKARLATAPVLAFPQTGDSAGRFVLDTDASAAALGAVLSQEIGGTERVIAYGSKTLNKAQRNYCTTRRELLSIVHFCRVFRPYLLGKRFLLRTDHASLTWLLNLKDTEGQLARWLLCLQEFDFEIRHRSGTSHTNADALSRHPKHYANDSCPSC